MAASAPRPGSLRDYQIALSERLQSAGAGAPVASKLGLQVGGEGWLVDLTEAGELIPPPAISPVPLARPWFSGVANVRGNLYSVTDFSAFLGGEPTALGEQARLLILNERYRSGAALLVARSLGLHDPAGLEPRPAGGDGPAFVRGVFADAQGKLWKELDVAALIQDPAFLEASL
ncbi:MAG TPA: chemotaxis protein CheW [Burkholderiales bacterium]